MPVAHIICNACPSFHTVCELRSLLSERVQIFLYPRRCAQIPRFHHWHCAFCWTPQAAVWSVAVLPNVLHEIIADELSRLYRFLPRYTSGEGPNAPITVVNRRRPDPVTVYAMDSFNTTTRNREKEEEHSCHGFCWQPILIRGELRNFFLEYCRK